MNVLITGGSRGLGYKIAEQMVMDGHSVGICARNEEKLIYAHNALEEYKKDKQKLIYYAADISKDTDGVFYDFVGRMGHIDVLINNAAVYGQIGALEHTDWNLWMDAINVNLLASVRLTKKAMFFMKYHNKTGGKIIQISGGGATAPLENMSAYAISKAALVRFVECMAMELKDSKVYINAVAPGIMDTELLSEAKNNPNITKQYYNTITNTQYSFEKPVALVRFLVSNESNGISGKLISAKYDSWEKFKDHKNEIMSTDAYTLRRVSGGIHFDWDSM